MYQKSRGQISVLGLGIKAVAHITLESNFKISKADKVFFADSRQAVSDYLDGLGVANENLIGKYMAGKERVEVYEEIAQIILHYASTGKECVYLAPGNPPFLNDVVSILQAKGMAANIDVEVYAGVSSIDTLILDTQMPVGHLGLQCFEASFFITRKPNIDINVPLFLFQPNVIASSTIRTGLGAHLAGLRVLRDLLAQLYGNESSWRLVGSANLPGQEITLARGAIGDLLLYAEQMEFGTLVLGIPDDN